MEILLYTIKDRITSCKEGTVHQKREGVLAERGSPVPEWNYAKLAAALFFHLHFLSDLLDTPYGCTFFQLPFHGVTSTITQTFFSPCGQILPFSWGNFVPKPRLIAFLHPHFFFPLQVHTFIRSSGSPSTVTAEEGIGRNQ